MSLDDKLDINPKETVLKIINYIKPIIKKRDIEGFVLLFRDSIECLINVSIASEIVGNDNILLIATEGRFSDRNPTKENDLKLINRFLGYIPKENVIFINMKNALEEINKIFSEKLEYPTIPSHILPSLNYNLSYFLLRSMAKKEIEEKHYLKPLTKPITPRDRFIQKVIAHHKSQIRLNMILAFLLSETENKSFISHMNKTEWLLGFFTKFGTYHAADFLPLANLYKTQVIKLAKYQGFNDYIAEWKEIQPSGYKYFFNLPYNEIDKVLLRLEVGYSNEKIHEETNISLDVIKDVDFYYQASKYSRNVPIFPPI